MTDNTNAERQARWRAKRDAELARLRAAAAAAATSPPPPDDKDALAQAQAMINRLRQALAATPSEKND